jgi:hypothetical protein
MVVYLIILVLLYIVYSVLLIRIEKLEHEVSCLRMRIFMNETKNKE